MASYLIGLTFAFLEAPRILCSLGFEISNDTVRNVSISYSVETQSAAFAACINTSKLSNGTSWRLRTVLKPETPSEQHLSFLLLGVYSSNNDFHDSEQGIIYARVWDSNNMDMAQFMTPWQSSRLHMQTTGVITTILYHNWVHNATKEIQQCLRRAPVVHSS